MACDEQDVVDTPVIADPPQDRGQENATPVDPELDVRILNVLGEIQDENILGEKIHTDLARRWEVVLKVGLTPEQRLNLRNKYPPINNCKAVEAPKLNQQVAASLNEAAIRRDNRLIDSQNLLGASLSAIGRVLTSLLEKRGEDNIVYIEALSDAARLIGDVHHSEADCRRALIMANVNASFKETLGNTTEDGLLFGQDLDERVRAKKALEKSAAELKQVKPKKTVTKNKQLNFKSPSWQSNRQGGQFRPRRDNRDKDGQQRRTHKTSQRYNRSYQGRRREDRRRN